MTTSTSASRSTDGLRARSVTAGGLVVLTCLGLGLAALAPSGRATPRRIGAEHVIAIEGRAHAWRVRYPGADGVLGTGDDIEGAGDVHLPAGVPTRVLLHSDDYIYSLRVPRLALNEVAIPDMEFEVRLEDLGIGTYRLEGGEMCGTPPPGLQGHVVVHDEAAYWAALDRAGRP